MTFKIFPDPNRKTMSIPAAALRMAHLDKEQKMDAYAHNGWVLIRREHLFVAERIEAVYYLSELAIDIIFQLVVESWEAAGDESLQWHESDPDLMTPAQMLRQAEMRAAAERKAMDEKDRLALAELIRNGGKSNFLKERREAFTQMLEDSGVNLEGLCVLLEREDTKDE